MEGILCYLQKLLRELKVIYYWEQEPLKGLASDGELMSFKHDGFWQPMDTLRDKIN